MLMPCTVDTETRVAHRRGADGRAILLESKILVSRISLANNALPLLMLQPVNHSKCECGAKIWILSKVQKHEEGKWGCLPPGADVVKTRHVSSFDITRIYSPENVVAYPLQPQTRR